MVTINDNTITATRDELTQIIDKSIDRKIKSLPDRSALAALSKSTPSQTQAMETTTQRDYQVKGNGTIKHPGAVWRTKDEIQKSFRFFHAVSRNDHQELRSIMQSYEPEYVRTLAPQVEGTNSAGGYLVPPEFYGDVLFLLNEFGFARKYCAMIQMQTNVLNVSTLSGKPSVAWTTENGVIPSSKGTFGRLTLTAQKLAAIYPISNELLADANVDVYNTILRIFVEVFGQEEDTQVFRGTGSPFTGILSTSGVVTTYLGASSTSGKTKYTDITLDDLINLVQSVGPAQQRGACLFVEQNTMTDLLKKKDSQNRYLWDLAHSDGPQLAGANGLSGTGLTFRGYPVVALPNGVIINGYDGSSHASIPFAVFGNLKNAGAWIGTHGGMDMRISGDATVESVNAFTNDLQLLRMTERIAFGVGQPGYLAVLSTSAS
jgi:HK97 family phage major capsid protein